MNVNHRTLILHLVSGGLLGIACLTGCRKQDVVTLYTAPKEPVRTVSSEMPADHPPIDGSAPGGTSTPGNGAEQPEAKDEQPTWTIPDGWKPTPVKQMEFAAFMASPEPAPVRMTVVPLGQGGGGLLANINRWEGQVHLPPSSQEDLAKVVKQVSINGTPVTLVNLINPAEDRRLMAAILRHGDMTWFFKMVGAPEHLAAQEAKFDAFLHSVRFGAPADATPAKPMVAAGSEQAEGGLTYATPKGWTREPARKMMIMSFSAGEGDDKADIAVTRFPTAVLEDFQSNLNRWRGQVGLPPSNDQPTNMGETHVGGLRAVLITLDGPAADGRKARQLKVAITPDNAQMVWFFKIVGSADAVSKQQEAFDQFLGSLRFAGQEAGGEAGK